MNDDLELIESALRAIDAEQERLAGLMAKSALALSGDPTTPLAERILVVIQEATAHAYSRAVDLLRASGDVERARVAIEKESGGMSRAIDQAIAALRRG